MYIKSTNTKFLFATLLHAIFVTVEFVYGIKINSISLLADAVHNAADVVGVLIAWFSYWIANKAAPQRFTFGFKKATVIAAFINAVLLLLSVGGIAWEAIMRLLSPQPVISVTMIVVASVGFLINGLSAYLFLDKKNVDINIKGVFIHLCADALVSVGVIIAGILIFFNGWLWADPAMSLIAAVFIFFSSWCLFVNAIHFMMLAVPDSIDLAAVKSYISNHEKVCGYHDLHVWPISVTEFALSVHIIVKDEDFSAELIKEISQNINQKHKIPHITIQPEIGDTVCEYSCNKSVSENA